MQSYNIHEAKTYLSKLVEDTEKGEAFVISKRGKPVSRLLPFHRKDKGERKLGFAKGVSSSIPDDFDSIGSEEISHTFYGK